MANPTVLHGPWLVDSMEAEEGQLSVILRLTPTLFKSQLDTIHQLSSDLKREIYQLLPFIPCNTAVLGSLYFFFIFEGKFR